MKLYLIAYGTVLLVASVFARKQTWVEAVGQTINLDVAVYGATPGGVASAVAALQTGYAPRNYTVGLINPTGHVGGMVAGGLGHTDIGNSSVIGGIAAHFFREVCNGTQNIGTGPCHFFAPSAAEAAFDRMLSQASDGRLTQLKRYRVVSATMEQLNYASIARHRPSYGADGLRATVQHSARAASPASTGPAIKCIQLVQQTGVLSDPSGIARDEGAALRDGTVLQVCARVFIDATYEGDLAAVAGADLAFGREASSQHNESMAGMLSSSLEVEYGNPINQFRKAINGTGPQGELLPLLYGGPLSPAGAADNHTMAYNYRMCLARKSAGKSLPLPMPPGGYDPADWELLRRYIASIGPSDAGELSSYMNVQWLLPTAPDKSDVNNHGPITTDFSQGSWEYPPFNWTRRREIIRNHIDYTAGLMHFLAEDPAVPPSVHGSMAALGLPSDEFQDATETGIQGWPYQLYVREANRLIGQYVFLQMDRSDPSRFRKNTVIGLAAYNIDVHHGVRYYRQPEMERRIGGGAQGVTSEGAGDTATAPLVWNEGNFDRWHELGPTDIPYEVLVPRDDGL